MSDADEINISKLLSLALRHKPESIGIELDEHGWASVPTLLSAMEKHGHCVTLEQLKLVVANSDKQRFAFNAENTMIRANQGHSIPIELGYELQ